MSEPRDEALRLSNQLCFPLYAAARSVIRQYTPILDELNLTYTQYIVMMALWENHAMTAKELGACLHLDSGTLTPLLKRMAAAGLLTRSRSTRDERSLVVTITEQGIALRDRATDIPAKMAQCSKLTAEEAATLYTLLYKILEQDEVEE